MAMPPETEASTDTRSFTSLLRMLQFCLPSRPQAKDTQKNFQGLDEDKNSDTSFSERTEDTEDEEDWCTRCSALGRRLWANGCSSFPWHSFCVRNRRRIKVSLTAVVLLMHFSVLAFIGRFVWMSETIWTFPSWHFGCAALLNLTLPLMCWLTFEWMRIDSCLAARQAGWLFLYSWFAQCIYTLAKAEDEPWVWELSSVFSRGKFCMMVLALWWRVSMAENAFLVENGLGRCSLWVAALGLGELLNLGARVLFISMGEAGYPFYLPLTFWEDAYKVFAFLAIAGLCWCRFSVILHFLKSKPALLKGRFYLEKEGRWAEQVLKRVRFAYVLLCIAGAAGSVIHTIVVWMVDSGTGPTYAFLFDLPSNLYTSLDFLMLFFTCGWFLSDTPGRDAPPKPQPTSIDLAKKSSEWDQTVNLLASRYITARELLDFFVNLRDMIPHFDPMVHVTNDIVRAAIIHCTGKAHAAAYAYADYLQEKRSEDRVRNALLLAQRMVTHEWRNLFVYLVAAVLADALGQDEYGPIVDELLTPEGQGRLRKQLDDLETDKLRYWICTFCVNQHRSICGGFAEYEPAHREYLRAKANRADTARPDTQHQACSCSEVKYWDDGQDSISASLCEMNKFEDVMRCLKKANLEDIQTNPATPEFKQLVVIDRNFNVFSRVLCVAEMVEAFYTNIGQNVCLLWKEDLDADKGDLGIYMKLATLSVNDCSASQRDDEERIKNRIRDTSSIAEFDAQLQATIFGKHGLLGKRLVGFDVIYTATRAALRIKEAIPQEPQPSLDASVV